MQTLEQQGLIDLFYGDEAGFSLQSVVPYGWQQPGEVLERAAVRSPQLNVLGWLSASGHQLRSWVFEQSITSEVVIGAIDEWVGQLTQLTVLVLDNGPMHRSKLVKAQLVRWQQAGLYVFFLPAYSPHLNKIETLWRKMKYEWLTESAYQSLTSLKAAVTHLLTDYGNSHHIQFAVTHCIIDLV